jgi:hypothetical protein
MIDISTRNEITNYIPPNSIGCELGVFEGEFSKILLDSNKFDKLYLVDSFFGPAWNFGKYYPDATVLYPKVKNRFCLDHRVSVIRSDSIDFLQSTKTLFDFIYIDTIHTYDHLYRELEFSRNKIKKNGYICGHDYCSEFQGVIDAVREFTKKYNYKYTITQEQKYPSFIINYEFK